MFPTTNLPKDTLLNIARELRCTVCMSVLDRPTALHCGHTFCSKCCVRCIESKQRCPLCRSTATRRTTCEIPLLQKIVDLIRVEAKRQHCTELATQYDLDWDLDVLHLSQGIALHKSIMDDSTNQLSATVDYTVPQVSQENRPRSTLLEPGSQSIEDWRLSHDHSYQNVVHATAGGLDVAHLENESLITHENSMNHIHDAPESIIFAQPSISWKQRILEFPGYEHRQSALHFEPMCSQPDMSCSNDNASLMHSETNFFPRDPAHTVGISQTDETHPSTPIYLGQFRAHQTRTNSNALFDFSSDAPSVTCDALPIQNETLCEHGFGRENQSLLMDHEDVPPPRHPTSRDDMDDCSKTRVEMFVCCCLCGFEASPTESALQEIVHRLEFLTKKDPQNIRRYQQLTRNPQKVLNLLGELLGPYEYGVASKRPNSRRKSTTTNDTEQSSALKRPRDVEAAVRYAHYLCLLWSPQVLIRKGKLIGCSEAIQEGLSQTCRICEAQGATMKCAELSCSETYHVICAHLTSARWCSLNTQDYSVWCPKHRVE